jgi:hypothetical protein
MKKYVIKEELTKKEVNSEIKKALDDKDFEKKVKGIVNDVIENLFKDLWQRKSFWQKK